MAFDVVMPGRSVVSACDSRIFTSNTFASALGRCSPTFATATTVRVKNGKTLTTDGPFVAIKEALGGYLFFEADDLDAAIELAAKIPAASMGGAIEVRPLVEGY